MTYAVIMAGGSGTRFWPRSTQEKPKQFLSFFGDKSLLQRTVERIRPLIPPERILVITNKKYVNLVKEQVPEVNENHIIGEPVARNTAPCIALAAAVIREKDPEGTMVVLPSDHFINDTKTFLKIIGSGIKMASESQSLITIGIKPNRPETGYGYIQYNDEEHQTVGGVPVHQVITFAEKPDMETAIGFINSGDFLWNSGMFIWRADTILKEMQHHLSQVYNETKRLEDHLSGSKRNSAIRQFYVNCMSISIDYGVMEKAETVYVIPGDFGWNDVGSWMAVYELEKKDTDGNVSLARNARFLNTTNSYVRSESDKLIALIEVQGLAVVETRKAILVCRLGAAQEVKDMVEKLEKEGHKKFL